MSQSFESFGKYILLEKLAMGGMAEVYLGKNQGASGIAKFVAIKRILPQFSENPEFIDMFKAEAKIAVNLSHSNVVSIYEFGVEKDQFFLVMDFVDGRNLRQILNKMKKSSASFTIEHVLHIVKEVAAGLDHAHRCLDSTTGKPLMITHRDMSPQNIMISFEGEVKIVDFGIAKAESQLETTRAGTLKGKFGYMSPEQAEGLVVDLRTDIFSLGIVLWELIANDRLFVANNEMNTLRKIRDCVVPSLRKINPSVPQELERICNKALAKDRNLRYQTSAEFQRDLSRFLNRQYPDFSPHDFSSSIKNIYTEEILESRKKQVEFAKATIVPRWESGSQEATSIVYDHTRTKTAPDHEDVNMNDVSDLPDLTPSDELKMEVEAPFFAPKPGDKLSENSMPGVPPRKIAKAPTTDFFAPSPGAKNLKPLTQRPAVVISVKKPAARKERLQIDTENSFASSYSTGTTGRSDSSIKINSGWGGQAFVILAIVIGLIGFASYRNPVLFQQWMSNARSHLALKQPKAKFTENASEEPTDFISVTSIPSGAEIIIDKIKMSDLTPATIQIPHNASQITVRLADYLPYSVKFEGQSQITASLVRSKMGYVDLTVMGAGDVFINEVAVARVPRYAIPADQDVKIRVYDAKTHASDQTVVRVPENRVKKLTLFPKFTGL